MYIVTHSNAKYFLVCCMCSYQSRLQIFKMKITLRNQTLLLFRLEQEKPSRKRKNETPCRTKVSLWRMVSNHTVTNLNSNYWYFPCVPSEGDKYFRWRSHWLIKPFLDLRIIHQEKGRTIPLYNNNFTLKTFLGAES